MYAPLRKNAITISGKPLSGKSTVNNALVQSLGYKTYSVGDKVKQLAAERGVTPEDFYKKNVQNLLSESVKRRLVADVPLGISLSGGIDSSILVAMASRHSKEPVKTFTIGFDANDEDCRNARIIANHFGKRG